jgi:regulation of enolase protein 1 (concanavalin A-like superfamily)
VFRGGASQAVEGPPVGIQVYAVAGQPGWMGSSINEGKQPGSARFQPVTGEITLRGSGSGIWDKADGSYFLNRSVTGDFRMTVRVLTRPTETHEYAKAGLMIPESLAAGARNGHLVTTARHGVQWQWRPGGDGATVDVKGEVISHACLRLPILLRLTRRGNTITAQYSRDEGWSFQPAGPPLTFDPPLASTVYAGLAITAHDENQVSEAKFSGLEIRKR